jgi:hypothetical protein
VEAWLVDALQVFAEEEELVRVQIFPSPPALQILLEQSSFPEFPGSVKADLCAILHGALWTDCSALSLTPELPADETDEETAEERFHLCFGEETISLPSPTASSRCPWLTRSLDSIASDSYAATGPQTVETSPFLACWSGLGFGAKSFFPLQTKSGEMSSFPGNQRDPENAFSPSNLSIANRRHRFS